MYTQCIDRVRRWAHKVYGIASHPPRLVHTFSRSAHLCRLWPASFGDASTKALENLSVQNTPRRKDRRHRAGSRGSSHGHQHELYPIRQRKRRLTTRSTDVVAAAPQRRSKRWSTALPARTRSTDAAAAAAPVSAPLQNPKTQNPKNQKTRELQKPKNPRNPKTREPQNP